MVIFVNSIGLCGLMLKEGRLKMTLNRQVKVECMIVLIIRDNQFFLSWWIVVVNILLPR